MVLINIYSTATSFTFYHGLSGYYKVKILGWTYIDTNPIYNALLIGVNINELRVNANPYTFTFMKNATTSHYPQEFPPMTAQLNQYFTVNLLNISPAVPVAPANYAGFTLYLDCQEILQNNLISN